MKAFMISIQSRKLAFAMAFAAALTAASTWAADEPGKTGRGIDLGNGGDTYAMQFIQISKQLQQGLQFIPVEKRLGIDPAAFQKAIDETRIESTSQPLYLSERQVDAINYPSQKRIVIYRPLWDSKELAQKRTLVMHEYLGILGIDDSRYQVSMNIMASRNSILNPCAGDENRWYDDTIAFFAKKGYKMEKIVGNGSETLTGSQLYTIRGYHIPSQGDINALFRMGECNPVTGKYEHLMYSASGSGLNANTCGN